MNKTLCILLATFLLAAIGCRNEDSFSALQKKEANTISAYIARQGIKVTTTLPTTWDEKTYYKSPSGLYFHLTHKGDTAFAVNTQSRTYVGLWMIEYELDVQNTIRSKQWYPGDVSGGQPLKVTYGDAVYITLLGAGLYEAIGLMKYHNAEARIIVPSSLNTSSYSRTVKPVSYDLRMDLKLIN